VAWFGANTPNIAISVTSAALVDASTFVSQSVPATMQAGQACNVWVRMKNTGTSYWTAANLYNLGSLNPTDNQTWGLHRVGLPATTTTVAPNGEVTFSFTVTAPTTPGSYNFQWQTVHDGVAWFGSNTPNVVVSVTNAVSTGSAEVLWMVTDHLGTPRMVADLSGSLSGIRRHDYLPFGEEVGAGTGGRTTAQGYVGSNLRPKWAKLERDSELGLDYAQARYYSPTMGRFTSVDPENAGAWEDEPQSWTGYSYVQNNPLSFIDPTGLERDRCDENGNCEWVGDFDGEQSKELSGGIFNDGAYWNKKEGIWETRAQFRDRMSENPLWAISLHMQRMEQPMTRTILVVAAANLAPAVIGVGSGVLSGSTITTLGITGGVLAKTIPPHVRDVLRRIKSSSGRAPSGYKGGRTFKNDGRGGGQTLPKNDASGNPITYREYDVQLYQQGVNRGTERVVRGSDGSSYYTSDHYGTFTKIE
jgi:RHS repeat-associated protein